MAEPAYRLVGRPGNAVLFHNGETAVSAATFLRHCHALAAMLPAGIQPASAQPEGTSPEGVQVGGAHMINLCRDRYAFTVAFAASVLRRHVCLLTGERSAAALAALAQAYPGSYIATDEPAQHSGAGTAVPICVVVPGAIRVDDGHPDDGETDHGAADDPDVDHGSRADGDSWDGDAPANPAIPAEQLAAIVFTSGSTGMPTPHRKLWGALAERSQAAAAQFELHEAEPCGVVGTVPPQHMYGFETTVLLPLHAPTSSWCGPTFYPTDVQAALAAVPEPRILVTTPLQMGGLLRAATPLPALRAVISATAPLDADLAAAVEAQWQTQVLEIFGATEVGSIASRRTIDGDRWALYPEVRLTPQDDLVVVTAPFAPPVPLADEVELLEQDQFRLLGRRTDIVKLGGHRASLSGLNRVLTGLDGVTDGTFVVPDDLNQQPTARLLAVVVAPDRSADSILRELRERLDPLFLPRRVVLVPSLPRNALGKLPREALLRMVSQDDFPPGWLSTGRPTVRN
ncbi:MAG TPA: AMP-binding protein [Acetobacteraceae bacterium]|jgi:acyl-CoA synthetase (AMP-forming)/AMP-acid ligase II|nr:AMP-binding protein [Acetobacteraceae bacterium]